MVLPDNPELKADLCSARRMLCGWKIAIEPKDKIKEQIGRSLDKEEAVIYASVMEPDLFDARPTGVKQAKRREVIEVNLSEVTTASELLPNEARILQQCFEDMVREYPERASEVEYI